MVFVSLEWNLRGLWYFIVYVKLMWFYFKVEYGGFLKDLRTEDGVGLRLENRMSTFCEVVSEKQNEGKLGLWKQNRVLSRKIPQGLRDDLK